MASASSLDILRNLLRQFVLQRRAVELQNNVANIEELWTLLSDNRLCSLLRDDDRLFERQTAYRQSVWSVNAPALSTICLIAPLFEKDSIPHLFIKGPLMLHEVYQDYFFRPTTDVDVLVASNDFYRAGAVLAEAGFVLEPDCKRVYWRIFLGEQHYYPPHKTLTVVDLHRRVRHPAGPATMERFLDPVLRHKIGGRSVAVPTPVNLALLLVVYLLKGIMTYEAVGYFLLDLAMLLARMDERAVHQLIAEARERKLTLALCLALRAVRMIAPLSPLLEKEINGQKLSLMSDAELFRQLLVPGIARTWPRIRALIKTCDHVNDLAQAVAWEVGRKIAQRACGAHLF